MGNSLSPPSLELLSDGPTEIAAIVAVCAGAKSPVVAQCLPSWEALCAPLAGLLPKIPPLCSKSNRALDLHFSEQLYSLIYFHVEAFSSVRGMIEEINDPEFVPFCGLPQEGLARSTFSEAINSRGLPQMLKVFEKLSLKASKVVGRQYESFGDLEAIDGSLIEATLSMTWAEYRTKAPKAKVHLGFDINAGIPRTLNLTGGNGAERVCADAQMQQGKTTVMDRGYQDHRRFDLWQEEDKDFVCRIRANTQKTIVQPLFFTPEGGVFFFAEVILGDENHKGARTVRLVGFRVRKKTYWIATSRTDLSAQQIATIYGLRWHIETFFAWWKRHMKLYHIIARSPYGLLMQILAGLITYLLLVIYFFKRYKKPPTVTYLRQLQRDLRRQQNTHPNAYELPHIYVILCYILEIRSGPRSFYNAIFIVIRP